MHYSIDFFYSFAIFFLLYPFRKILMGMRSCDLGGLTMTQNVGTYGDGLNPPNAGSGRDLPLL